MLARTWLLLVVIVLITCAANAQSNSGATQLPLTATFPFPPDKPLDLTRRMYCTAIASAHFVQTLHEEQDKSIVYKLVAEIAQGTDKLTLWVQGRTLWAQHTLDKQPYPYRITGRTKALLAAMYVPHPTREAPLGGLIPGNYSIVLSQETSFSVYTFAEGSFFSRYPRGGVIYLRCAN